MKGIRRNGKFGWSHGTILSKWFDSQRDAEIDLARFLWEEHKVLPSEVVYPKFEDPDPLANEPSEKIVESMKFRTREKMVCLLKENIKRNGKILNSFAGRATFFGGEINLNRDNWIFNSEELDQIIKEVRDEDCV